MQVDFSYDQPQKHELWVVFTIDRTWYVYACTGIFEYAHKCIFMNICIFMCVHFDIGAGAYCLNVQIIIYKYENVYIYVCIYIYKYIYI